MQTFQMDNQKANTRTNLQKERHKKQSKNSIILPIRALKFKPKTKGFSIVQIFENRKFIYLTLKASVYQQLAASKQKSSHRLNVFFYSSSSKYNYVHSIPTKDNLHTPNSAISGMTGKTKRHSQYIP